MRRDTSTKMTPAAMREMYLWPESRQADSWTAINSLVGRAGVQEGQVEGCAAHDMPLRGHPPRGAPGEVELVAGGGEGA